MFAILMNEAGTVKDLLILVTVAMLSMRLLDRGDNIIQSVMTELFDLQALWPIVLVSVVVIIASFFMAVIIVMQWAIRASSSSDVVPMPLVSLFGIGVLVGCLKHLTDRSRWLLVELGAELGMMVQS